MTVEPEQTDKRVQIAVFDFDRTCIDGRSPVRLTTFLTRKRQLHPTVIARMLAWGFAYSLHLPQNESWVRQLLFTCFDGLPKTDVDAFLSDFYDDEIDRLFRHRIDQRIKRHKAEGCYTCVISASFEPIITRCIEKHPFDAQISTRMLADIHGNYVNRVDGLPVEGDQKVARLKEMADKKFGKGNWNIAWAYSDHYSDAPMLRMADHPVAVDPDKSLRKIARKSGWEIMDF